MSAATLTALAALASAAALTPRREARPLPAPTTSDEPLRQRRARRTHWRARRGEPDDLPEAIELIVLAVRSGLLPSLALAEVLPALPDSVRPAFEAVARRCSDGERFADALAALPSALGPAAAPIADSLAAADRYGLPLAPVLERLAAEARLRRRRHYEVAVRRLPVRLTVPLVLCTLPSFVLLAIVPLLLGTISSLHR